MMKKNLEKILIETFGYPIDTVTGANIAPLSSVVGATKDHDINDLGDICPACGMMPQAIDEPCTCGFIRESNECNQCGMTEGSCCCGK